MASAPIDITPLLQRLHQLRDAYEGAGLLGVSPRKGVPAPPTGDLRRSLQLCEALIRNVLGTAREPGGPTHVCVFGGTQVGKSTMVNVLAQQAVARVYHTAGYTRHAQGFGPGLSCSSVQQQFPYAFPGFQCVGREELSLERPREYSVSACSPLADLQGVVLWDAPDCDAVDAHEYQEGLIEALTLADVVIYVTSREKYAVNHLLQWLSTLLQTGVPVIGVLNMAPAAQQPELLQSMKEALAGVQARMRALDPAHPLRTFAFEYVTGGDSTRLFESQHGAAQALRAAVAEEAGQRKATESARRSSAFAFLQSQFEAILAPGRAVLKAHEEWDNTVTLATNRFVQDYQNGYLNDPERYDAFKQVGIEILKLLNPPVPGLQKALYTVRTMLSLPARAILFGSRALWRFAQNQSNGTRGPVIPNEIGTYQEAHARVLNSVSATLAKQQGADSGPADAFWSALGRESSQRLDTIQQDFQTKLAQHRARTDEWVQQTAHGIYAELAKDPVKLNLLRTGRIAADAGAILVAIHTGGHGNILHDLIVTPAVMSVIEAISQQIAGSYVEARRLELRDRLLADTKVFAEQVYGVQLRGLAERAMNSTGFGTIDRHLLAELPSELAKLQGTALPRR